MKSFTVLSALAAIASVTATPTKTDKEPPTKRDSFPTVTVSGNAFWADKERFYLRGIDYQPGGSSANTDPLADYKTCSRDIAKFKDLGVNTIRVYAVDNSAKHDDCMKALQDAGIYLVLDITNPKYSLNRAKPALSYNAAFLQSVFATVEMFSQYTNTLAFFSGNEVINDEAGSDLSAPYIKALTRDVKAYMKSRKLRAVPIGYSAADVSSNRMQTAQYMNCGSDDMRSDFFAFNDYSWCNSNFETSGWDQKVKNFTDYGVPIFLSEYGCIKNRPRKFDELSAMMSSKMSGVYSGGLMYEYSYEDNKYGIVKIKSGSVSELDEYANFKSALKENPAPTGSGGAATATHAVKCPSSASGWNVNPSLIPAMPKEAKKYISDGAGKGPGFGIDGAGSQDDAASGMSASNVTVGSGSSGSSGSGNSTDKDSSGLAIRPIDNAALMVGGFTALFTMVGTLLL